MKSDLLDLQWFAAEDEGRTEEPSEYKLRKAREEGRVPKSQDLNSSLVFLFTVIVLVFLSKSILCFHTWILSRISWLQAICWNLGLPSLIYSLKVHHCLTT